MFNGGYVQGETKERWDKLCALVETELNEQEFVEVTQELNDMLDKKLSRLNNKETRSQAIARTR